VDLCLEYAGTAQPKWTDETPLSACTKLRRLDLACATSPGDGDTTYHPLRLVVPSALGRMTDLTYLKLLCEGDDKDDSSKKKAATKIALEALSSLQDLTLFVQKYEPLPVSKKLCIYHFKTWT
jgi:hypothetical protein